MRTTTPSSGAAGICVLVVDANRMATQLLADVLQGDHHFKVVHGGPGLPDPITKPDVALISSTLGGQEGKGCEFARQLLKVFPKTLVIMLVEASTRDVVLRAFRAGARGIFSRDTSLQTLPKCITSVHKGQLWATNTEMQYLLEVLENQVPMRLVDAKGTALLTNREQEVVRWVTEGLGNRDIAKRLQVSEHTVKNYLFRIFDKLGVSTRVELILYALNHSGASARNQAPSFFSDDETLFHWCRQAAENGCFAPYALGEIYVEGRAVPRDKVSALAWFTIAESVSMQMQERSRTARMNLRCSMSPTEIDEAERRAKLWLTRSPRPPITGSKHHVGSPTPVAA